MEVVYFIADEAAHRIKIGFTSNLSNRMACLRGKIGRPLRVIHTVIGGRDLESICHDRFHADRMRGEWFRDSPTIRAYFGSVDESRDAADAIECRSQQERLRNQVIAIGEPQGWLSREFGVRQLYLSSLIYNNYRVPGAALRKIRDGLLLRSASQQ